MGDATPIDWVGREARYQEKLATPDVTIADLIGEIDMIKHAEGRYLSSELTMHFGLIPRTNRGIFCINELPDLSPKIQVGLFNVLEERDVQIRGYPDPAQPRPLHGLLGEPRGLHQPRPDRHAAEGPDRLGRPDALPADPRAGHRDQRPERLARPRRRARLAIPLYIKEVVEEISRLARSSSHVNQQSGVSVRMSIANLENVVSNAERRALLNRERWIVPRVSDLPHVAASSRGKLELTMTEDDGHEDKLIGRIADEAVKNVFAQHLDAREFRAGGRLLRVGQGRRGRRHARRPRRCSTGSKGPRPPEARRRVRPPGPARPRPTPTPATPPPPAPPSSSSKGCTSTTS